MAKTALLTEDHPIGTPYPVKYSRTFGSFQTKWKAMLAEKIRKIILAFYFSYAFVLLKIVLLFNNDLVV